MGDNYERLVKRISESAKLDVEEIERRIEAKRAKLSGLVSKEGAAQIVAAELGINFDQERIKISELVQGMRRANIIGKVIEIYPIRNYNKNGRTGKVCNLIVADETSNIKAVLWDTHHIELVEREKIKAGDFVEISNAGVRNGELHLSGFSDMKKSKETIENVVARRVFEDKRIADVRVGDTFKTRAVIVQVFEPRYFEVCERCEKKIVDGRCAQHGNVKSKKRALLNIVLDDGSETIRCVIFGEVIKKLGFSDEDIFNLAAFSLKKESLLGDEKFFIGSVRNNQLYNAVEMTISDIDEINPLELIKKLESKS